MKVKLTYLEHLNGCFTVSLHCLSECFYISCNRVKRQRSGKAFFSVTKLLRLRSITSTWHASSECQNQYMSSVSRASSLYSHIQCLTVQTRHEEHLFIWQRACTSHFHKHVRIIYFLSRHDLNMCFHILLLHLRYGVGGISGML